MYISQIANQHVSTKWFESCFLQKLFPRCLFKDHSLEMNCQQNQEQHGEIVYTTCLHICACKCTWRNLWMFYRLFYQNEQLCDLKKTLLQLTVPVKACASAVLLLPDARVLSLRSDFFVVSFLLRSFEYIRASEVTVLWVVQELRRGFWTSPAFFSFRTSFATWLTSSGTSAPLKLPVQCRRLKITCSTKLK